MNNLRAMLFGALTLGIATAQAADSVDLAVTGQVVPAACTPTLSSNTLDFGTIPIADLNASTSTDLPPKPVALTLTCDAAAKVAFHTMDNRAGSAWAASENTMYGLGYALGNIPIGRYQINASAATGDGASKALVMSPNGALWGDFPVGGNLSPANLFAMADAAGDSEPGSYTVQSFDFTVHPTIAPTDFLPISSAFELDGSVTFEIVYL